MRMKIDNPLSTKPARRARRRLAVGILVSLPVLVVSACGSSGTTSTGSSAGPRKPSSVSIGWVGIESPTDVGVKNGAVESALGVPIKWSEFQGAGGLVTALTSGSTDISLLGSPAVALAIAHGIPIKVIWVAEGVGANEGLVARNSIHSVADLVGKTVATVFGSTSQFTLISALQNAGVDPKRVNIINLDPPSIAAAWQTGHIDAAYIWNPALAKMVSGGGHILVDTAQLAKQGQGTYDLIVARTPFVQAYPELITAYGKAELSLLNDFQTNPQNSANILSTLLSEPAASVAELMKGYEYYSLADEKGLLGTTGQPGTLAQVLEKHAQTAVSLGLIPSAPALSVYEKALAGGLLPAS